MKINGFLFDGITSEKQAVTITLLPEGNLSYDSTSGNGLVSASEIKVSRRLGNVTRYLRWHDCVVESNDNDAIDKWLKDNGKDHGLWLHRLESNQLAVLASVVALVVTLILSYLFVLAKASDTLPLICQLWYLIRPAMRRWRFWIADCSSLPS